MFNRRRQTENSSSSSYWISYSDLLAGTLLVFLIILVVTLVSSKRSIESKESQLQKISIRTEDILGIRQEIIRRLKKRFADSGSKLSFDNATGAITLGSSILFREDSAKLRPEGKKTLRKAMPDYFDALLGSGFRKHVGQISFNGHTNSNYSGPGGEDAAFLYNLQLSQRRAFNAMRFLIRNGIGEKYNTRQLLVANGYSYTRPVFKAVDGEKIEDKQRSRRLNIQFRLKNRESLEKLRTLFQEIDRD